MNKLFPIVSILILIFSTHLNGEEIKNTESSKALWMQFAIGSASVDLNYDVHPKGFMKIEPSAYFRWNHLQISSGYLFGGTDSWEIHNYWGAIGFSKFTNIAEASIDAGLSSSYWEHQLWEAHKVYSPRSIGGIFRANALLHLLDGYAGIGMNFTAQFSKEVSYKSFSFFLCIGNWNF